MSQFDKICESCDEEFSSFIETVCDDCHDESEKERADEFEKLKKEITSLRESLSYALELDEKGLGWRGYVLDKLAKIKAKGEL